jgi:hypothetical protein
MGTIRSNALSEETPMSKDVKSEQTEFTYSGDLA